MVFYIPVEMWSLEVVQSLMAQGMVLKVGTPWIYHKYRGEKKFSGIPAFYLVKTYNRTYE